MSSIEDDDECQYLYEDSDGEAMDESAGREDDHSDEGDGFGGQEGVTVSKKVTLQKPFWSMI